MTNKERRIYTTYTMKGSEALSLIMMIILTPGAFINLYFQIAVGASAWIYIPTALSGFFSSVLTVMVIYYRFVRKYDLYAILLLIMPFNENDVTSPLLINKESGIQ